MINLVLRLAVCIFGWVPVTGRLRHGIALALCLLVCGCAPVNFSRQHTVNGVAGTQTPWCQGAAPLPGEEWVFAPYQTLHFFPGDTPRKQPPYLSVTPDKSGAFSVTLAEGEWCVVARSHSSTNSRLTSTSCDFVVNVNKNARLHLVQSAQCDWERNGLPPPP